MSYYDIEPTGKGTWHALDALLNSLGETAEEAREAQEYRDRVEAEAGADF